MGFLCWEHRNIKTKTIYNRKATSLLCQLFLYAHGDFVINLSPKNTEIYAQPQKKTVSDACSEEKAWFHPPLQANIQLI